MKLSKIVADVCLFGNPREGAGWCAETIDRELIGDGEPREGRTFTGCLSADPAATAQDVRLAIDEATEEYAGSDEVAS